MVVETGKEWKMPPEMANRQAVRIRKTQVECRWP